MAYDDLPDSPRHGGTTSVVTSPRADRPSGHVRHRSLGGTILQSPPLVAPLSFGRRPPAASPESGFEVELEAIRNMTDNDPFGDSARVGGGGSRVAPSMAARSDFPTPNFGGGSEYSADDRPPQSEYSNPHKVAQSEYSNPHPYQQQQQQHHPGGYFPSPEDNSSMRSVPFNNRRSDGFSPVALDREFHHRSRDSQAAPTIRLVQSHSGGADSHHRPALHSYPSKSSLRSSQQYRNNSAQGLAHQMQSSEMYPAGSGSSYAASVVESVNSAEAEEMDKFGQGAIKFTDKFPSSQTYLAREASRRSLTRSGFGPPPTETQVRRGAGEPKKRRKMWTTYKIVLFISVISVSAVWERVMAEADTSSALRLRNGRIAARSDHLVPQ